MKTYTLVKFGTPYEAFELRESQIPAPGRAEVLIKVRAFGLNYADIMARQGLYKGCPPLPCVLGYDVEGVIEKIGPDVDGFHVGDPVFALTRFGGYAEYAVTPVQVVGHMRLDAPVGLGCALAVQGVTAYHAAIHMQTLLPGEKVLIHAAAGGLGTSLVQIALSRGCVVIAVAGGEDKMNYLRKLGVVHVIDRHKGDYQDYVSNHFGGRVDVIFDNIGGASVQKAKSMLAPGGRIISLGAAALTGKKGKLNLLRLALGFGWFSPIPFLGKSQSFIGINMLKLADHRPDIIAAGFKGVQGLISDGILKPHIGNVFPHQQLAAAHALMQGKGATGKVVMQW